MPLQFYQDVLPSQGRYCLFVATQKRHVWFDSLDALDAGTQEREDSQGIYFATASFQTSAARTGDNVAFRRSLAFDIDAGEEKFAKHGDAVYPTQREALLAVAQWVQANSLKPSYVVSSGAGLHVYFCLDADVELAQWLPLAKALKAMALAQGLRIDPTVTSDAARVLRPPGTLHSSGARVAVLTRSGAKYNLNDMAARVAAFVPQEAPARKRSLNAEVLEAPVGPPKSAEKIRQNCAAMQHAMGLRGDVAEPYWRAMLGVIKFTQEGSDAAHTYSQGHPEYDYDVTQSKLDRWTAGPTTCATFEAENPSACSGCAHRGTIKSPIQLGMLSIQEMTAQQPALTVEQPEAAADSYMPFSDEGEELAAPATHAAPMPWDGYLPHGFHIIKSGNGDYVLTAEVQIPIKTPTGEESVISTKEQFCPQPYWLESWAPGTSENDQAMSVYTVYDNAQKKATRYTLPTRLLAKRQDFIAHLAGQNVQVFPATTRTYNSMEQYIRASMERIRAAGQRPKIMARFGSFYNQKGELTVAQGPHLITRTGDVYEGVVQEKLRSRGTAYTVPLPHNASGRWGPEVWQEHILPRARRHVDYLNEFYSDSNFLPYQLAISLAISSPLLTFVQGSYYPGSELPGMGLTVSLFSPKSGIGKTSAMAAAALAYGVPNNIVSQLDRNNSTGNARGELALQAGTMPSFMDEMEDVPPAELASLISAIGNGVSKTRLKKDLSVTGGEKMTLINVMSTNKSHREIAAVDRSESMAVQFRLLEIECSGVTAVSRERSLQETEARSALADCAGALGAVLHYEMCRQGGEMLNKAGIECADKARAMLDGGQDGRFMWRALGALLLMRRLLKPWGLKFFNLDELVREFKRWHDASYEFAVEGIVPTEPDAQMALFLSDIAGSTLITRSMKMPGKNTPVDVPLNDRVPENVLARSVLDEGCIYFKSDALRDWCHRRKVSHHTLLNACRDMNILEPPELDRPSRLAHAIDLYRNTKMAQNLRVSAMKVIVARLGRDVDYTRALGDNVRVLRQPDAVVEDQIPKSSANS